MLAWKVFFYSLFAKYYKGNQIMKFNENTAQNYD